MIAMRCRNDKAAGRLGMGLEKNRLKRAVRGLVAAGVLYGVAANSTPGFSKVITGMT